MHFQLLQGGAEVFVSLQKFLKLSNYYTASEWSLIMENVNYRENIEKKIVVTDLQKSENGKYFTGTVKEENDRAVYVLSEKTDNLMVIAVIVNEQDNSQQWVAADADEVIIEPDIRNIIDDDSDNEYYCLYEKTCGSIVYLKRGITKYYLLIENHTGHIGFPKGHVAYGETEEETAIREVFEETFLNITIDTATRQEYTYKNPQGIIKNCVYFCSEFKEELIRLQEGEIMRCWLVPYDEALELLNYPHDKVIFEKADQMND